MKITDFNSRAHVERDAGHVMAASVAGNFNSRAHVERDIILTMSAQRSRIISTHALTWSATLSSVKYRTV